MGSAFSEHFLEQPVALDFSAGGRVAVLDRGGRRLCVGRDDKKPCVYELDVRTLRCRFHRESVVLLGDEGQVRTVRPDGEFSEELRVRPGAVNLAVMKSGSVLVTYGRRGAQEHGVTLERLGATPLVHKDPALLDATGLAVESGGFWIAGTGSSAPASRAVRLRPVASGLSVRQVVPLAAPPRSAAIGPDGALYVVLEPGESFVRVYKDKAGPVQRLPEPVHEIARHRRLLWSCGPRGLRELTQFVPPPGDSAQVTLHSP